MPIGPRTALAGAGACLAMLVVVWFCAFHVTFFEHADQSIFLQFSDLYRHNRISTAAGHLVRLFDLSPYVFLALNRAVRRHSDRFPDDFMFHAYLRRV